MKFNIQVNKKHFYDFNKYTVKKINQHETIKPKATLVTFLYWFFLAFTAINLYNIYSNEVCWSYKNLNFAVSSLVIWLVLVNAWYHWYLKLFAYAGVNENGHILGNHEIEITEQGITSQRKNSHYFLNWNAIQSVEKNKNQLYLYIDNTQALIIPLEQVNDEFESLVSDYRNAASK